jgi:hypothetical protein
MTPDPNRGLALTLRAIRRQLDAMPHDLYLLRLIHCHTRRPLPGRRLWTPDELLDPRRVRFLRIRNLEGFDIYIHPDNFDQNAGYILLDLDHPAPRVPDCMRRNGHHPCLVLETSPGRLQAWVHVCTASLEPGLATAIARHLALTYGGDPASADWHHLGRLAGFTNRKPARRTLFGFAPWVKVLHARAGLAPRAADLIEYARTLPAPRKSALVFPERGIHAGPVEARMLYHNCVCRWAIAQRFPSPDWSIVDLWVARHLLARGLPAAQVAAVLRCGSPHFPRQHGDPDDYLRRTLARARATFPFPPSGGAV